MDSTRRRLLANARYKYMWVADDEIAEGSRAIRRRVNLPEALSNPFEVDSFG